MAGGAVEILLLGLAAGVLVGLMGLGGGVIAVPMLVHLLGFTQHRAQGTSLFVLLPPIGLGALREYWISGDVDVLAGSTCALGALVGGYGGSVLALWLPARQLKAMFGIFLMLGAILLLRQADGAAELKDRTGAAAGGPTMTAAEWRRLAAVFLAACVVGAFGGLFGVGGGILFVPLLVLAFGFAQHRAQGTTLVALVPPTGLLAFINYARAGQVDWRVGLLLMPGVFLGGVAGARLALRLAPRPMRLLFAALVFLAGLFEVYDSWIR